MIKISNELSDMEELNEDLNRFWDLGTVEIMENKVSVYDKFL